MSGEAVPDSIARVSSAAVPVLPYASRADSGADDASAVPEHRPYVPAEVDIPEFTWGAVLLGTVLGIIYGASSLYLALKVGMTVSASIPVAVLSITLFRVFARVLRVRRATILENNIVQTTGSAGESIAAGIGFTIPALLLLGFEMDLVRVMTVGVLGGLLGILMMIPLRRAFIVKQHGKLLFPEGTACADVLIIGEKGGATAKTVFAGFGLAFLYKIAYKALGLWNEELNINLFNKKGEGLPQGVAGGELSPELLGVGYIIGPRIASTMLAGAVLAYLIIVPAIAFFSSNQSAPLGRAAKLVKEMDVGEIRSSYVLYIGAGAVAAGGLISMFRAIPLIFSSVRAGVRDIRTGRQGNSSARMRVSRTDRDLPLATVLFGSIGLVIALSLARPLGLGFSPEGIAGAALIVLFGFLFVTVSSRLTGEIGSSSNPISGMTVATLLFTCLAFLLLGQTHKGATLTAITVAAVVCVAASNGGTTAQDLKTGYLVGATPWKQQYAILIGTLTSALVIGVTLLVLNRAGTVYSTKSLPDYRVADVSKLSQMERAGGQYASDTAQYHVLHVAEGELPNVQQGKYLVDEQGKIRYLVDPAINGRLKVQDDNTPVNNKLDAPKARLMSLIVDGILNRKLPWGLVLMGVLIAVMVELLGMSSLPFAVGVYLPIQVSMPIFIGGVLRWLVARKNSRAADSEMSSGTLMSTGYIAGGTIAGLCCAVLALFPKVLSSLNLGAYLGRFAQSDWVTGIAFAGLLAILLLVGLSSRPQNDESTATVTRR
jgi:putative OPT family oligopeptide transporter